MVDVHLTGPKFRSRNMRYNFHVNERLIWVLKFCVQNTRLEAEEIANIHLHKISQTFQDGEIRFSLALKWTFSWNIFEDF